MFLAKHVRLDILTGVVFLSRRVLKPNTDNWEKLLRIPGNHVKIRGSRHH